MSATDPTNLSAEVSSGFATHAVMNQPRALHDYNAFSEDKALVQVVNVICLDALRPIQREPDSVGVFLDEVRKAKGADVRLDAFADQLERKLWKGGDLEPIARRVVEMMALALRASLLVRYSIPEVADAFCATRLVGD